MSEPIRFAVLTVSDRCYAGTTEDTTGPALVRAVSKGLDAACAGAACVPDEADSISGQIVDWARGAHPVDLVLTTGGTGLAPRDVTPEATAKVIERPHPGLLELARLRCLEKTPRAYLSRGVSGTIARTLVINLPGSRRGATETFEALVDLLPHAIETLRGDVQDDGRPDAVATTGAVVIHAD